MRLYAPFLIILGSVFLLVIISILRVKHTKNSYVEVQIANQKFSLEVASSIIQKMQGLSNRKHLCDNCGMIFVYNTEGIYPFWMKDTLIPLDMIWLDKTGKIVTIHTAFPEPNVSINNLKQYKNNSPAQFVVEINANLANKLNLKVGDKINVPRNLL